MMVSSEKEVAFNQAVLYASARLECQEWCWRMNKCWQPIVLRHCYQKYLSHAQASWEIFQLTFNSEKTHCRVLHPLQKGRNDTAKLSPLHVADYVLHSCQLYIYQIFLHVTICKLSLHFTINFTESILNACADSVYQVLPPIFWVPENEATYIT